MDFNSTFDVTSVSIALAAAIELFRYKRNVMEVIAASAVIGLMVKLFCETLITLMGYQISPSWVWTLVSGLVSNSPNEVIHYLEGC